ncbi:MAG: cation transporter [Clostridia bacterium]|nr:cation transporter [Clostridia bacterium]
MTELLCKLFVKDRSNIKKDSVRRSYGTLSSVVGIILNILLAAFKLIAGTLSASISITADAVNNLSDAGSQVISLISFKISAKPADRDHPFGHARIEYVASMIVSFIILTIGFELFRTSLDKIFNPTDTKFGTVSAVILAVSVIAKLWVGFFNRRIGKKINSSVIKATSIDSFSDAAATSAVLISMLISHFTGLRTDGYMGIIVSVFIFIAGIRILSETKNSILGSPPDPEVISEIYRISSEFPEVLGIHDMVVHNYGPGNTIASLHAEVDGEENVFVTHDVIDNLEKRLFSELGVRATIHMDPIVTNDERLSALKAVTLNTVQKIDSSLTLHDFRFVEGRTHSNLIFDISAPFELKISDDDLKRMVSDAVSEINPNYFAVITIDRQ